MSFELFPVQLQHKIITYCSLDELQTLLECNRSSFHAVILSSRYVLRSIEHYASLRALDLASNSVSILWQMLSFGNMNYEILLHSEQCENEAYDNNFNIKFYCDVLQILLLILEGSFTEPVWIQLSKHCIHGIENATKMNSFTDMQYRMLNRMLSLMKFGKSQHLRNYARCMLDAVLKEMAQLDIQCINNKNNARFSSMVHITEIYFSKITDIASNKNSYFVYHRLQVLHKILKKVKLNVDESAALFDTFITRNTNEFQISLAFDLFRLGIKICEMDCIPVLFQRHMLPRYQFSYKIGNNEWKCFQLFMGISNKHLILPEFYSQLSGMKELWNIILNVDEQHFDNAVILYFSFIKEMKLRTTDDVRNAIAIRSLTLYKCMMELNKAINSLIEIPKHNQFITLYRMLRIIRYLLFDARLSSRIEIGHPLHIQLQNSVPFEIQINDKIHIDMANNVQRLMVRETMTLYDIQKIFANECPSQIPPECIDIGYGFIEDSLKTIGEMGWNATSKNNCCGARIHKHSKQYDLLESTEDTMVEKCVQALIAIFIKNTPRNSTDYLWNTNNFKRYIIACGAGNFSARESRIQSIFIKHCKREENSELMMNLHAFLDCYHQACIDDSFSVWCDLYVHGYRYDYRTKSEVIEFEKPMFMRDNCLLYQMIDNEKYWSAIQQCFKLPISEDTNKIYGIIKDVAYDIILHLPTKSEILEVMKIEIEFVSVVDELFNNKCMDFYWLAYRLILCEWLWTNDKQWCKLFKEKKGIQFMSNLLTSLQLKPKSLVIENGGLIEETKENGRSILPNNHGITKKCIAIITRIIQ